MSIAASGRGDSPTFSISVPVKRGAKTIYVLSASIAPQRILEIFQRAELDPGWVATVTDRTGTVVARSKDYEKHVGKLLPKAHWGGSEAACGLVAGDRRRRRAGAARLDLFAAIGLAGVDLRARGDRQPADRAFVGARRHAGGELCAFCRRCWPISFGRKISDPVRALVEGARELGRGEAVAPIKSSIREVRAVGEALARGERNAPADGALAARERGSAAAGARLR